MGFNGELVEFPSTDGLLLSGFLQKFQNAKACLIHVHGMESSFYGRRTLTIGKELSGKGIACLAINTRGHDGVSWPKKWSGGWARAAGTSLERFEDCISDISGAIKFAKGIGFKKFILSGQSTGCQKITYYQYKKQDRNILGMVLLAPADDYNLDRKRLGRRFENVVKECKLLVAKGMGRDDPAMVLNRFSAKRFLSVADLENVEARLFNYDGEMWEFSKIRIPVCAVFGSIDEAMVKPAREYMNILGKRTNSRMFVPIVMKGSDHSFSGHETELAKEVYNKFISRII